MARGFGGRRLSSKSEGVAALVEEAFARLTGLPMSHPDPIFVPHYDHGAMSSGHVSPGWGRETGLPLPLDRRSALPPDRVGSP